MSNKKRIILTVLAIIGLFLTFDLIYIYIKTSFLTGAPKSFCSINNFIDCDGVAVTKKAFVFGVPLAIWGLILYLLFLFLTWVDKIREKIKFPLLDVFKNPSSYIASIGLFSFCCSVCLALISFFDIKKLCILCFCTYFINLFIAITAVSKDFFITDIKNMVLDFIDGVKKHFILFLTVCVLLSGALAYFQTSLILAPKMKMQKSFQEFEKLKTNIYAVNGNYLGNPDGDVSIFIYGDFMCPFCRIMNMMLHKLAKEDKGVGVYHINFPLDSECNPTVHNKIHPGACLLARYALAAQNQGSYFKMVNLIYNYKPNSEDRILKLAEIEGFDIEKLKEDAHSDLVSEYLENQIYRGIKEDIIATPTLIIDGIPHNEVMPYYRLVELVKQSRKRHENEK